MLADIKHKVGGVGPADGTDGIEVNTVDAY